jgi:hypothetical protein
MLLIVERTRYSLVKGERIVRFVLTTQPLEFCDMQLLLYIRRDCWVMSLRMSGVGLKVLNRATLTLPLGPQRSLTRDGLVSRVDAPPNKADDINWYASSYMRQQTEALALFQHDQADDFRTQTVD